MLTTQSKPVLIRHRRSKLGRKDNIAYVTMLLPVVILLFLFNYLPMGGLVMAFQRFVPAKGLFSPDQKWVGLRQFQMAFADPLFPQALSNTLYLSITKMVLHMVCAIGMSILMNELRSSVHRRTVQTLVYIPHFISWVILGSVMRTMFASDGIVNQVLLSMGMKEPVGFLTDPENFSVLLIISDVWKEFGWNMVIYLAGMQGINNDIYEAAAQRAAECPIANKE